MSTTQFIFKHSLGLLEFLPPEAKGKKTRYGKDAICWLCAGNTGGVGWHVSDAIGSAFTDCLAAKSNNSSTLCQACAALMKKEAWVTACEKFNHSPHFPVKDGKEPFLSNWMFSSHLFSEGVWIKPDRKQARDLLLSPPQPPFVITLAAVGKKHIIFRSNISFDRDSYFVQLDEMTISVNRLKMIELIELFEIAYEIGFSKESILTGKYNQAAVMAVGFKVWRELEDKLSLWRIKYPGLMLLCNFCAQKSQKNDDADK
ncbi:MAG: hypothetical protein U5M23_01485 [Marinagarivorans sp.]|nr:hypothetical protein [Marinagarivorans sp.]